MWQTYQEPKGPNKKLHYDEDIVSIFFFEIWL